MKAKLCKLSINPAEKSVFTIDRFHQIEIKKVSSLSVKFRIGAAEMGQVVSNYTANWQRTGQIKVLQFQLKCFENPFGYPFNLSRRAQVYFLLFVREEMRNVLREIPT